MPELPEVETVRKGLLPLVGSQVVGAEVLRGRSVRHQAGGREAFGQLIVGKTITEVARRGKFLWFPLIDDADGVAGEVAIGAADALPHQALIAHLGMSGQLRLSTGSGDVTIADGGAADGSAVELAQGTSAAPGPSTQFDEPDHPHLRVRLLLETPAGRTVPLDFIDQRTFGYLAVVKLIPTADGLAGGLGTTKALIPDRVSHIGRDILDDNLSIPQVAAKLQTKKSEIKRLLLDQTIVSGIGNIYADEALWQAKLHPTTIAASLTLAQITELLQAANRVVSASLSAGGTSFDSLYVDVFGAAGEYGNSLAVYGRADQPCPHCGTAIERHKFMNRSSYLCPTCQPSLPGMRYQARERER